MKFFFIKSILLITLVFILGITIRSFLPYMVSAPLNYVKHKTFEDKKDKLDILFLGTSRTHNGFSPTVFEKELQKISNTKYSAFNYGIGGASMGESVALFHRVLEDENYKGKYLVVELAAVTHSLSDQFFGENLHTTKNKYWLDKQMLEFSLQNTKGFDTQLYNADQKRDFTKNYMLLYISNLFNIGIWNDAIPTFLDEKN